MNHLFHPEELKIVKSFSTSSSQHAISAGVYSEQAVVNLNHEMIVRMEKTIQAILIPASGQAKVIMGRV